VKPELIVCGGDDTVTWVADDGTHTLPAEARTATVTVTFDPPAPEPPPTTAPSFTPAPEAVEVAPSFTG
jgi:hypothetical protein